MNDATAADNTPPATLVLGCGNRLRGDDAAGPHVIERLRTLGTPSHVRLVDIGTLGVDVAFRMQGARQVVLVDACRSGAPPGSVFEITDWTRRRPNLEVGTASTVPTESDDPFAAAGPEGRAGLEIHSLRWDQALDFARWYLQDAYPDAVRVFLIEGLDFTPGAPLSRAVEEAVEALAQQLAQSLAQQPAPPPPAPLNADGTPVRSDRSPVRDATSHAEKGTSTA